MPLITGQRSQLTFCDCAYKSTRLTTTTFSFRSTLPTSPSSPPSSLFRLRKYRPNKSARNISKIARKPHFCLFHSFRLNKSNMHRRPKGLPNCRSVPTVTPTPADSPRHSKTDSSTLALTVERCQETTNSLPETYFSPPAELIGSANSEDHSKTSGCKKSLLSLLVEFQKTSLITPTTTGFDGNTSDASSCGGIEEELSPSSSSPSSSSQSSLTKAETRHLRSPFASLHRNSAHNSGTKRTIPTPLTTVDTCFLVDDEYPFVHLFW